MTTDPKNISIVLVEPQGGHNIGSICRVMMNFGFQDLRLVNPRVDHLCKQARDMAVTAKKTVLRCARKFKRLEEAIGDCHLIIGSTRRFGKYRNEFIRPDQLKEVCCTLSTDQKVVLTPHLNFHHLILLKQSLFVFTRFLIKTRLILSSPYLKSPQLRAKR